MQKGKVKFLVAVVLGTILMTSTGSAVGAAENPAVLIEDYVSSINEHNWDKFSELHISAEEQSLHLFFDNLDNQNERNGVLNVKSATLKEVVEINYDHVKNMLYESYDPNNVKVFIFGVDYNVYRDTKYYSSGINYNFITFIQEASEWQIVEMLPIANPEYMIDLGYNLSDEYDSVISVMDARNNGYLMNYNEEVFATLDDESISNPFAITNNRTVPTSSTTIRYKASNGVIDKNLNFHSYCLGVLAGELRHTDYDGNARKAQAMAIKTFTWHYKIIPQGSTEGYDVNSVQQAYEPTKVSENKKVKVDYDAVKDIWMESASGAIFTAYYKLGVDGDQAKYKNGGEFKQKGAKWLLANKKVSDYYGLLHYYYDNSTASSGGPIRFFDKDKNQINK